MALQRTGERRCGSTMPVVIVSAFLVEHYVAMMMFAVEE